MMSRLPIRLRLSFAVAATLAVVLAAVGAFVYARVETQLDNQINAEIRQHLASVADRVHRMGATPAQGVKDPLAGPGPSGTQVLDATGRPLLSTPSAGRKALLDPASLHQVLAAGRIGLRREHGMRLASQVVRERGQTMIAVSSGSLDQRDRALSKLLEQLIVGGVAGLLAAALAAYAIARRAFRPFERMRRQADQISASEPGARLEIPTSDDELARLGRTLNAMLQRLEGALEHERRFVAEASHELRTPLAVLRAELELARSRPRSREELEDALDSVAEETDRLTRLADDLLLLARADEGVLRDREALYVADVLETTAAAFETRAAAAGRAIEIEAPEGLSVRADPTALHRALTNLVDNALRHGAGTVRLRAAERGNAVEVHVTDEGEGFPADFLPTAFERFSRAGRAPDGTGLGLALVRAVAVAHGGAAGAGPGPDGGADVWVSLPRSSAAARAPERVPAPTV